MGWGGGGRNDEDDEEADGYAKCGGILCRKML